MSGSRGKQRHEEEHEEHENHEAWVIPYADVLTLLMALFLVLWALGDPNAEKLEIAADSFRRELGGSGSSPFDIGIGSGGTGPFSEGGQGLFDGAAVAPDDDSDGERSNDESHNDEIAPPDVVIMPSVDSDVVIMPTDDAGAADAEAGEDGDDAEVDGDGAEGVTDAPIGDPLDYVEQVVRDHAEGTGLTTAIGFRREARGLVVSIVADEVLFEEASADVRPEGIAILGVVGGALLELSHAVAIEGHTDSRPISTGRYPSNWELSTARATSVLRFLVEDAGVPPERVSAAGYADTRPVAEGDDPAALARNRRVEIVVLSTALL